MIAALLLSAALATPLNFDPWSLVNGRLAPFVTHDGFVIYVRWPGTFGPNQALQSTTSSAMWRQLRDRQFEDVYAGAIGPDGSRAKGGEPTYRTFAIANEDALVIEISSSLFSDATELYWQQAMRPATTRIPEASDLDFGSKDPSPRSFATFKTKDPAMVVQFRPREVTMEMRERAGKLAESSSASFKNWAAFGEGTWIAACTDPPAEEIVLAPGLVPCNAPPTDSPDAILGDGLGLMRLHTKQGRAKVTILFAKSAEGLLENCKSLSDTPIETLWAKHEEERATILKRVPGDPNEDFTACLGELLMARDEATGGFNENLSLAGRSVWALLLAGQTDSAQRYVEFCLTAINQDEKSGRPLGSVPPALMAPGVSSYPRHMIDARAASSILEAAFRYVNALEDNDRRAFLEKHWAALRLCGDFVVGWTRGTRGEPFASSTGYFDKCGLEDIPCAMLGVTAAIRMAQMADKEAPETWKQRDAALEILLRTTDFTYGGQSGNFALPAALDLIGLLPDNHPFWNIEIKEQHADGDNPSRTTTMRESAWQSIRSISPFTNRAADQIIALRAAPQK